MCEHPCQRDGAAELGRPVRLRDGDGDELGGAGALHFAADAAGAAAPRQQVGFFRYLYLTRVECGLGVVSFKELS